MRGSSSEVPLYRVYVVEGNGAFERPASYAATRPLVPGEEINVEREFCVVERIDATSESGYDAALYCRPTGRRRRLTK